MYILTRPYVCSFGALPGILNISLPLESSPAHTPLAAESILQPYLDAVLTLTGAPSTPDATPATPLFTTFFIHHEPRGAGPSANDAGGIIVTPPASRVLPTIADNITQNAEVMFWRAVKQLKAAGVQRVAPPGYSRKEKKTEEAREDGEKDGDEGLEEIDSLWPPLDATEDDTADEW